MKEDIDSKEIYDLFISCGLDEKRSKESIKNKIICENLKSILLYVIINKLNIFIL